MPTPSVTAPADRYLRNLLIAGSLLQLLFLTGAFVFFRERILYADTAHFAAEIAGGGRMFIGHRWIAAFSRLLPFAASVSGASTKWVLILYSANLALIYTVPFLLIGFLFRNRQLLIALLAFQFLFIYRTFYLPISELQHGLVLLLVWWGWVGWLTRRGVLPSRNFMTYVLLFLAMNAHPMMLIAFLASAALLYDRLTFWNPADRQLLMPVGLLFFFISTWMFYTQYEAVMINQAVNASLGALHVYQLRLMAHTMRTDYLVPLIAGTAGLIALFRYFPMRRAVSVLFAISVTAVLVYLRFAHRTFTVTFFEVYISVIPFLLFLSLALAVDRMPVPVRQGILIALATLTVIQISRTIQHSTFYTTRLKTYEQVFEAMEAANCEKAALPFYKAPMNVIVDFYATPFETLLMSRIDNRPDNDHRFFTYLPADSIDTRELAGDTTALVALGMASLDRFEYTRYPRFHLESAPYCTLRVNY